jgi:hypothetical protein
VSAINKKDKHMVRKQQPMAHRPSSTKVTRSGLEKMRMNNERIHREIERILTERRTTGSPIEVHDGSAFLLAMSASAKSYDGGYTHF